MPVIEYLNGRALSFEKLKVQRIIREMEVTEKHSGFHTTTNGGTGAVRKPAGKKEVCTGCQQPIIDRYIMRVMDNSWHEGCLQCSVCHVHLSQTCYSRDRKLYCKADYDKLYAVKCTGCIQPIAASELVMRALDHVYHLACFVCVGCSRQLQKGDQFVIRNGRLYCRPDFEKEMAVMQIVTRGDNGQLTGPQQQHNGQQRQDGRRGPKRPRTILTTAQRRAFKASFEISQKPCRKVRESLAKETGLSVRIVQVWFQNQRAKLKKLQRKQQQLQQQNQKQADSNQTNGGGNEITNNGKDSKKSEDLNHSDAADYTPPYSRLAAGTDPSPDSSQFPLAPVPYPGHGPDSQFYSASHTETAAYMKTELSMDSESSLGGLEDVLIDQGQTPQLNDSGHIFNASMNPIDKLYSMQTSYFSSNECECLGATN
ncbi:LIM homeobox transcription factor 1-beta-like isoform X1 [Centruroides sculpturatus]|uniref:LIM homeobox transcription factor 1-beta-like isoform X1 n=1 Tax=Centruroides sculpturatus TaxID=218467 RepID=UPI000C6D2F32|nr:LIM homeobox transcription factor 1-beta-like isoform X1 [Centruroides sculpturatus]